MNLRHILGSVVLLAIVGAAATVTTTPPSPSTVLSVEVKGPNTTTSISFSRATTESADPADLLPPQTTTTVYVTTTTSAPETGTAAPVDSSASTTTVQSTTTAPSQAGFDAGFESSFFSSINSLRASKGLATLTRNGSLDAEARAWSQTMAGAGLLSHSDLGRFIPPWSAVAENVGNGPSVSSIFAALSASSGHLANMTGDYTNVGIGVWVDSQGTLWTTHIFTK